MFNRKIALSAASRLQVMERLRLAQSNRWLRALQLGGTVVLATLLLLAILSWAKTSKPPTVWASSPAQEIGSLSNGSVITIGATLPLTAPGSASGGEAMKVALEIAADEINAAGGLLGMPVQLVISDTAGMPQLGEEAMDYFAQIGVAGVVGEYHSAVALSMIVKAHEHHIPVIFAETWHDDITALGYAEVFRIAPVASEVSGEVPASYISELGFDNVVIITDDSGLIPESAASLESALTAKGITWQTFTATVGTTDFTSIISDIQALTPQPQAIFTLLSGDDAFNFEQQSAEAGLAPSADTICIDTWSASNSEAFWQNVPDGNYCVFRHIGPVQAHYNGRTLAFATEYVSRTGKSFVELYAMEAYDSLIIMADAISRAGSTAPDAIIAAIEATDLIGAQGRYYFPYGSSNPVPGDVPAYMWHQWPDPYILMLQYFEVGQAPDDAAVVYPEKYRTHGVNLIPYGSTGPQTVSTIDSSGGTLTSSSSSTTITFGQDVLTASTIITYTPFAFPFVANCVSDTLASPGNHYFRLEATYDTGQPAQPAANMSYSVVVTYTDDESSGVVEDSIALYWCDGDNWSQEGITSTVNITDNVISSDVNHFSEFAILGQALKRVYLPIILKDQ
jgi:branched-chain amino acid transport system substrate-binding protein